MRALRYIVLISCITLIAGMLFAVWLYRGLPQLRTWVVAEAEKGAEEIEFSFTAPTRDVANCSGWSYQLGIIIPKEIRPPDGEEFISKGSIQVYSGNSDSPQELSFESATYSNWLRNSSRLSYLIITKAGDSSKDFGIKDGLEHRVIIHFNEPLESNFGVALHFLSHDEHPQKTIKMANNKGCSEL